MAMGLRGRPISPAAVVRGAISRRAGALLALALCVGLPLGNVATADEVVETWPDGTPRVRTWLDPEGRKNGRHVEYFADGKVALETTYARDVLEGPYTTYHPNGRPALKTTYRGGKLVGRHETFDADGAPLRVATYANGRLDGRVEFFRARKPFATQTWKDGEIVTLDGVPLAPRAREDLDRTLAAIAAGTAPATGKPAGKPPREPKPPPRGRAPQAPAAADPTSPELEADREAALRRLKQYRCLCGLPWDDLVLDPEANRYAQAAAEICAALGAITHEPPNPGWDADRYAFAAKGAASCNLHQGVLAAPSVDGYLDDSDPSNVGRVGHRRWCLALDMVKTGFGVARSAAGKPFTAMWAMDHGRAQPPDPDVVTYPARGWQPVSMFGAAYAWCVAPSARKFPRVLPEAVHVVVRRLDADFVPTGEPLPLEAFSVQTDHVGLSPCVIFRPRGVEVADGAAYWVEVTGLTDPAKLKRGAPPDVAYAVRFYGAPPADDGR